MTQDELQRRADAVYRWAQQHQVAADAECPVCSGVRWMFRLDEPGRYLPRVCMSCGYVQWFDAQLLGVMPAPGRDTAPAASAVPRDGEG